MRINEVAPTADAPVDDRQPVVGSPEDLALPAPGQSCDDCGRRGHATCG